MQIYMGLVFFFLSVCLTCSSHETYRQVTINKPNLEASKNIFMTQNILEREIYAISPEDGSNETLKKLARRRRRIV